MIRQVLQLADRLRDRSRRRNWNAAAASGRRAEDLAHRFLQARGFRIVARNYRPRSGSGEIDLVAWEGTTLVFVEVKSRLTAEFGSPERAVGNAKTRALIRSARDYARRAGAACFEAVTVVGQAGLAKAAYDQNVTISPKVSGQVVGGKPGNVV